jgi:hypothetical protein
MSIKSVPFTEDELQEIQLSLTEHVLEINHQIQRGSIPKDTATKQIQMLSQVIEKCSQHQNKTSNPLNI